MKTILKYLLILQFFAVISCLREPFDSIDPCPCDNEKEITLKLALPYSTPENPVTRTIGAAQENAIETLDVLAFKVEGGVETFLYRVEALKDAGSTEGASLQQFNTKVVVKDFTQRFVLITNARSKIQTHIASRPDGWVGQEKEAMFKDLTVDLWDSGLKWTVINATNYMKIPMWGETKPVTISATTTSISDAPIIMLRMIAKVDIQLDQSVPGLTDKFKIKSIHITNVSPIGRIVPKPGPEYIGADMVAKKPSLPVPSLTMSGMIPYTDFSSPGIPDIAMRGAIYLLEADAKNTLWDDDACIVVGGLYESDTQETYYRLDYFASDGKTRFDILRNHKYTFNITAVHGRGYSIIGEAFNSRAHNIATDIIVWDMGQIRDIIFDNQYMLGVSQKQIELSGVEHSEYSSDNIIKVAANNGVQWRAAVYDDLACTIPNSWITITRDLGSGHTQADEMKILVEENKNVNRTAYIRITAGRFTQIITVTQLVSANVASNVPENTKSYVGAFWRHNQTGERIIRIKDMNIYYANNGPWSATVAWYDSWWNPVAGDGIVLSTDNLSVSDLAARGISFSSVIPNNQISDAENHKVTGKANIVNGVINASNPDLVFRIGLQKNFAAYHETHFPARYAVVVISYGTPVKFQRLYIRQGEGADFTPGRTSGARWSPYNLGNVSDLINYPNRFVQYPSQAGFFYQWTSTIAYPPIGTVALPPDITGIFSLGSLPPTGYFIPSSSDISNLNDGTTTGNVWGYYADGFFDRRKTENNALGNTTDDTAVSKGNNDVAYFGGLFYNATGNFHSSVFFPTAGLRQKVIDSPTSDLISAGWFAAYWASTSSLSGRADAFAFSSVQFYFVPNTAYASNNSVRCVRY